MHAKRPAIKAEETGVLEKERLPRRQPCSLRDLARFGKDPGEKLPGPARNCEFTVNHLTGQIKLSRIGP